MIRINLKKVYLFFTVMVAFVTICFSIVYADEAKNTLEKKGGKMTTVRIETSKGVIVAQLDGEKAPETVRNFLSYTS
jgi:hypothetical protein